MSRRYEATFEENAHHIIISVSEEDTSQTSGNPIYEIEDDLDATTEVANIVLSLNYPNTYDII